jgi:hypothetical protein
MKSSIFTLSLICVFQLLVSCSTTKKIEALRPDPSNDSPIVFKNKTSFVAMPITITLSEIEHQLNKNLSGLIYN